MSHKDGTNNQVEKNYLETDGNIMTQVQDSDLHFW